MKKLYKIIVLLGVIVLLTACGRNGGKEPGKPRVTVTPASPNGENPTPLPVTVTPEPTLPPTPTPTPTPDPLLRRQIADIYPEEYKENLYRMEACSIGADTTVIRTAFKDGYVFLLYSDKSAGYVPGASGTYCIFHLRAPERRVYAETTIADEYCLGKGGMIYEIYEEDGIIIRKNPWTGESMQWEFEDDSVFLGETQDGKVWVHTKGGLLRGHSFEAGGKEELISTNMPADYHDLFVGEEGDILFLGMDVKGEQSLFLIDRKSKGIMEEGGLVRHGLINYGAISYPDSAQFRLSRVNETEKVRVFPKQHEDEYLSLCDGNLILSRWFESKGNDRYEEHFRILDIQNGGELGRLDSSIFGSDYTEFDTVGFSREGYLIVLAYRPDFSAEAFLLDVSGQKATPDNAYQVIYPGQKYPRAAEIIKRIEDKFPGVHVYYDLFSLSTRRFTAYGMTEMPSEDMLLTCLERMERIMTENYPEGFFEDLYGESRCGLDLYLCAAFTDPTEGMISLPAGVTNTGSATLEVALCAGYATTLEQNFAHELFHASECRIREYEVANGVDFERYWKEVLNSPKYPHADSYLDGRGNMISDYSGTTVYDVNNAWYIDAYAKSNELEDRARTFEYMYLNMPYYFQSPHLLEKARFLCVVLREVFPSIAKCEEPLVWEKLSGIVPADEYLAACRLFY